MQNHLLDIQLTIDRMCNRKPAATTCNTQSWRIRQAGDPNRFRDAGLIEIALSAPYFSFISAKTAMAPMMQVAEMTRYIVESERFMPYSTPMHTGPTMLPNFPAPEARPAAEERTETG